jgi:uncharacterized Zn finger protein (UPF0148 family)
MSDLKCPNCGADSVAGKDGRRICPACGGSFKFEAGENRLVGVGEFDQLKKQVEDQQATIAELTARLAGEEPTPAEPDGDQDEGDDDDEGDL